MYIWLCFLCSHAVFCPFSISHFFPPFHVCVFFGPTLFHFWYMSKLLALSMPNIAVYSWALMDVAHGESISLLWFACYWYSSCVKMSLFVISHVALKLKWQILCGLLLGVHWWLNFSSIDLFSNHVMLFLFFVCSWWRLNFSATHALFLLVSHLYFHPYINKLHKPICRLPLSQV